MSASTGPILIAGGIVILNDVLTQNVKLTDEQRVIVGTLLAAVGLSAFERVAPSAAVAFAWLVVVGVTVVRIDPKQPSPLESLLTWYQGK